MRGDGAGAIDGYLSTPYFLLSKLSQNCCRAWSGTTPLFSLGKMASPVAAPQDPSRLLYDRSIRSNTGSPYSVDDNRRSIIGEGVFQGWLPALGMKAECSVRLEAAAASVREAAPQPALSPGTRSLTFSANYMASDQPKGGSTA